MLAFAFAYLAAAAAVSASPVNVGRRGLNSELVPLTEPGPWCDGLGGGAFDIAHNFSLSAFNSTLDLVGEPLVFGQAGAVDGASFKVFSVRVPANSSYERCFNYRPFNYRHSDRKSTRLNSSHSGESRMPSSA